MSVQFRDSYKALTWSEIDTKTEEKMETKQKDIIIKTITAAAFTAMIIVNALANALPINGQTTGQVSDAYPNLFAPAAQAFAIWGLIYLLLAGYTLYQAGAFHGDSDAINNNLLNKIGILFSVSCIANASWIFSWHYHRIPLSMAFIVVILLCLIMINELTRNKQLSARQYFFVRLPFSVYFGWITVATIANATALLVSVGWKGAGIAESTWTAAIIVVGLAIGLTTMLRNKDAAYGLVFVWAYAGILLKHLSPEGFGAQYPVVITAAAVCIVVFAIGEAYLLFLRSKSIR